MFEGARHLTSNRPIEKPDDLNDLILRVPNVPISVATWTALGAKPTPMAFSEVFTGLQSGTIEAQENPLALINSAGFHEVQDHVNLTGHVNGWVYLLIGEKQIESLSKDDRAALLAAGQAMQTYHQGLFIEEEKLLKDAIGIKGHEDDRRRSKSLSGESRISHPECAARGNPSHVSTDQGS